MSTKRYSNWCSNTHGHQLMEHPEGAWVRFVDYESLRIVESECHNIDDVVEIRRLKQQFSLAEEGLANYAQELADLRQAYDYHKGNAERHKQRCLALAWRLYPEGAPREAVAGDLGLSEPQTCRTPEEG